MDRWTFGSDETNDGKRALRSANILDPGKLLDGAFGMLQSVQDSAIDTIKKGENYFHDNLKKMVPGEDQSASDSGKPADTAKAVETGNE